MSIYENQQVSVRQVQIETVHQFAADPEDQELVLAMAHTEADWLVQRSRGLLTIIGNRLLTTLLDESVMTVPMADVEHVKQLLGGTPISERAKALGYSDQGFRTRSTNLVVIGVEDDSQVIWEELDTAQRSLGAQYVYLRNAVCNDYQRAAANLITMDILRGTIRQELTHLGQSHLLTDATSEVLARWLEYQMPSLAIETSEATVNCYNFIQELVKRCGEEFMLRLNFGSRLNCQFSFASFDQADSYIADHARSLFPDDEYDFGTEAQS